MKAILSIFVAIITMSLIFLNQELDRQIKNYNSEIVKLRVNLKKIKNFSEVKEIIENKILPMMKEVEFEKEAEENLINFYRNYKEMFNLSIVDFIEKRGSYLSLKLNASIKRSDLDTFFTFFTLKKERGFLNIYNLSSENDMMKIEFDVIEMYKKP